MVINMVVKSMNSYSYPSYDAMPGSAGKKRYSMTLEADPKDATNKANGITGCTVSMQMDTPCDMVLDQKIQMEMDEEDD